MGHARQVAGAGAPLATVAVLVEPPEFCGRGGADRCKGVHGSCGQGGDHAMAKNAASMQFTQGWDWIQSTPDRNTGLWDVVTTEVTMSDILIRDPLVRTLNVTTKNSVSGGATVSATAVLFNRHISRAAVGTLTFTIHNHMTKSQPVSIPAGGSLEVSLEPLVLQNVTLWWPHTHGQPALHEASFTFAVEDPLQPARHFGAAACILNTTVGLRTVTSTVDPVTRGRMFYINGRRIFIEGGNWIATDQFQRFAGDKTRYFDEVRYHAEMGLNTIRVWGGGLTERPEFFEACDQLGVLVMQVCQTHPPCRHTHQLTVDREAGQLMGFGRSSGCRGITTGAGQGALTGQRVSTMQGPSSWPCFPSPVCLCRFALHLSPLLLKVVPLLHLLACALT